MFVITGLIRKPSLARHLDHSRLAHRRQARLPSDPAALVPPLLAVVATAAARLQARNRVWVAFLPSLWREEPFPSTDLDALFLLLTDDSYSPHLSLSPVPSILDLPSLVEDSAVSPSTDAEAIASANENSSSSSSSSATSSPAGSLRNRSSNGNGGPKKSSSSTDLKASAASKKQRVEQLRATESGGTASSPHHHGAPSSDVPQEHKDADVLTKVVAYVGIGWLASTGTPWCFEQLGWSVAIA